MSIFVYHGHFTDFLMFASHYLSLTLLRSFALILFWAVDVYPLSIFFFYSASCLPFIIFSYFSFKLFTSVRISTYLSFHVFLILVFWPSLLMYCLPCACFLIISFSVIPPCLKWNHVLHSWHFIPASTYAS